MYRLGYKSADFKKWGVGGLIILALLTLSTVIWFENKSAPPHKLVVISKQVSYPLYFPKNYPKELSLVSSSIQYQSGVLTYYFTYDNGKKLIITEQEKPNGFDFSTLSGNTEFLTPIGKAYIVDYPNRITGSVVTEKTWIIINAPDQISDSIITQFINQLRKI